MRNDRFLIFILRVIHDGFFNRVHPDVYRSLLFFLQHLGPAPMMRNQFFFFFFFVKFMEKLRFEYHSYFRLTRRCRPIVLLFHSPIAPAPFRMWVSQESSGTFEGMYFSSWLLLGFMDVGGVDIMWLYRCDMTCR